MQGSFAVAWVGILGAVALGGCVGTGASDSVPTTSAIATEAAFDDNTGSIQGSVRTDEILPIVGAQVGIAGTALVTVTDAEGRFFLNFVPPGDVAVSAAAFGFQAASKSVLVVAGGVTDGVDFVLAQLPSDEPYHVTDIFRLRVGGYMLKATPDCMYVQNPTGGGGSVTKTCQGSTACYLPDCSSGPTEVHYGHCGSKGASHSPHSCDMTPAWQTIIGEVSWTPGTSFTGRGWSWEILAPNITRANGHSGSVDQSDKHDWWKVSSVNPIQTRIDDATFLQGSPSGTTHPIQPDDRCGGLEGQYEPGYCDFVWRLFPGWCTIGGMTNGAAGCEHFGPDFNVDQAGTPATVYFSIFLKLPAPPEFSAIVDS